MIIECAKDDLLCFTLKLKDGGETAELAENESLVFRCPVDCAESDYAEDGRVMLEITGIPVTQYIEGQEQGEPIPGVYSFIADLNNIGEQRTQVLPGRYPFEFRIETAATGQTAGYHRTIAFQSDNALIIHKGARK